MTKKETQFLTHSNISIYIGKTKCPKCKNNGYLTISKNSIWIRHYLKKYKTEKGTITTKFTYHYLTTMGKILEQYQIFEGKRPHLSRESITKIKNGNNTSHKKLEKLRKQNTPKN